MIELMKELCALPPCPPILVRKAPLECSAIDKVPFCFAVSVYHTVVRKSNICSIHSFSGMQMVTTAPPPSALAMSKVPPWSRTISSHTARPMPLPRALEEPL